jgi:hypothetical protein
MQANYDSQADALSIDVVSAEHWDHSEGVDEDFCTVAFAGGRPVNVELLSPKENLGLLAVAADRYEFDLEALEAAARAALAAPDRVVKLDLSGRTSASTG